MWFPTDLVLEERERVKVKGKGLTLGFKQTISLLLPLRQNKGKTEEDEMLDVMVGRTGVPKWLTQEV